MARELKVPVIALCQLSRGPESRAIKRPMLSDLRSTGAIEADADIVILLYRPWYYGEEEMKLCKYNPETDKQLTELINAKNRNGPTGMVKLQWNSEISLFTNMRKW
jgi:replicative DNA helicase